MPVHHGTEPPLYHAELKISPDHRTYRYSYNHTDILTLHQAGQEPLRYRLGSDGDMVSLPFLQQVFFTSSVEQWVDVTFTLSANTHVMQPQHQGVSAILGQVGQPLIYGVNGLYDGDIDLLISWHECEFSWLDQSIQIEGDCAVARMRLKLGAKPWILLFRMQYYRQHLGFTYYRPWLHQADRRSIAGWCSWEAYHRQISLADVRKTAEFLQQTFHSYGLDYMQIDDGYQSVVQPARPDGNYRSAFLETIADFPGGHPAMIDSIRSAGLKPGIWTNVSISNSEFAAHSPFIYRDSAGNPLAFDWLHFCLDMSPACLEQEIKPLFQALQAMGYSYFKVDSLRHLLMDAFRKLVSLGMMDNDQSSRRFAGLMAAIRSAIGPDNYLLACWGVLGETIGSVDACRIASDSNPSWKAIRMQLFETARWFFTQRILFTIDPDHICVRAKLSFARSTLSLASLSGSLYMISDKPEDYDAERISMIRQTLPPLATMTAATAALDFSTPAWPANDRYNQEPAVSERPFSTLWCVHFHMGGQSWAVVQQVATHSLAECAIPLHELGLDPFGHYLAYDFWQQRFLGIVTNELQLTALELGDSQVIGLRQCGQHPRLLASDRHVSMDAISVRQETWQQADNCLSLDLSGIAGESFNYVFWLPAGWRLLDARGQNADMSWHVVNTGESDEAEGCNDGQNFNDGQNCNDGQDCNDGQNCNDGLGISHGPAILLQVSLRFSQPDANLELFFQHME